VDVRNICKKLLATCELPKTGRDAVLLTFDDGPHPDGTPAVLDVLRRYHVRGVFFVVGSRVHRAPQLLRRIVDDGHIIGNHSFAHPLDRQFGMLRYYRDVEQCQTIIERLSGVKPTLFRPPLGHLSAASVLVPRFAGLTTVLWTVDSDDWRLKASHDAAVAADRLIARLSGRPLHDIVLLHDEKTYTAELLEIVLPVLASRQVDLLPGIPPRVPAA
jgi:peptidoglycan/xylan/chitin deacetylase (PgdA/CDA1 family)